MNGSVHQRLHLGTGVFGFSVIHTEMMIHPVHVILGLVIFVIGARLPDLDHRIEVLDHRGFSHTIWAGILVGGLGYITVLGLTANTPVARWYGFVITASYVFHLIQDMMTVGGGFVIRPLWPVVSTHFSRGVLKSDSRVWSLMSYLLVIVGTVLTLQWWEIL